MSSIHNHQPTSLGYREAEDLQLFRTDEGIASKLEGENRFLGLLNYPTAARFSGRAIRKMDAAFNQEGMCSTIAVYGNLKSGKTVPLFSINLNFFGRVQGDKETQEDFLEYTVKPFQYDPENKSLSTDQFEERSFTNIFGEQTPMKKDDIITSFEAEYLLGQVWRADQIHQFSIKFFNPDESKEKILLNIDVKEEDAWDLTLYQKKPLK